MKNTLALRNMKRMHALASTHTSFSGPMADWFIARYGVEFCEANADQLIDALDYGTASPPRSIAEVDAIMTECGYPPLAAPEQPKGGV